MLYNLDTLAFILDNCGKYAAAKSDTDTCVYTLKQLHEHQITEDAAAEVFNSLMSKYHITPDDYLAAAIYADEASMANCDGRLLYV